MEKVVCVTGGSGYVASWVVKLLLERGYTVRATVRDPDDPKKVEHLLALEGASERLHLFKADLHEEGAFDAAVNGCEGVFHIATPCPTCEEVTQMVEIADTAVKGTLNVLRSCAKASSIRRVVVTSSTVALTFSSRDFNPDVVVDETWFSDADFCREGKLWYHLGKTLADKEVLKFAEENKMDIVSMYPGVVIGPILQPNLNASSALILNFVKGSPTYANLSFGFVNVKDVSVAHILAFEDASPSRRYCLVERVHHYSEIVEILRGLLPYYKFPAKCADDKPFRPTYQVSKEKAQKLGIDFIPLEVSLRETIDSLKEKKFLHLYYPDQVKLRVQSQTRLLEHTVKKTQHLHALQGASERLHLYEANILDEGAFDEIVSGCNGVFHTASPVRYVVQDPQAELIDPAVKGTLNVLRSCAKTPSIKRVVVTSSMAAATFSQLARTPDVVVDETWFSDSDFCRESKLWYALSKTLAEEQAWKFAEEAKMDIVTINPAMVLGPLLQPTLNSSVSLILDLINGSSTYPNATFGYVNVKDVAQAHVLAFEDASANGRYCLVERVAHYSDVVKILHELYPDYKLPAKCADEKPLAPTYQVSKIKAQKLGLSFIPLVVSLRETVESLKEKHLF
ncbi:phenylacetaldehyde reductase-like [Nymphaea colorata]|nr:phenylacetaldehyde reductase-like [Nymphaea colorata]